ncbi:unnamed protein product [Cuscuta epithymum]|uniref:Uncharacterized protein n=1 Tax=Cuscuta epithymum TaxID=186058 RepID=A0AAV0C5Z0_9ASTE|nr:unnamed protein product [Cuscuta epithymum]
MKYFFTVKCSLILPYRFERFLQQEISTFSSFYFEREVITRRKRPARNDDIGEDLYENVVSIFNYPGRGKGATTHRNLTVLLELLFEFMQETHLLDLTPPSEHGIVQMHEEQRSAQYQEEGEWIDGSDTEEDVVYVENNDSDSE